jgi:hypothetical protein
LPTPSARWRARGAVRAAGTSAGAGPRTSTCATRAARSGSAWTFRPRGQRALGAGRGRQSSRAGGRTGEARDAIGVATIGGCRNRPATALI